MAGGDIINDPDVLKKALSLPYCEKIDV